MRLSFLLIVSYIISCTPQRDRIIIPKISEGFYSQSLLRIDEDLKGNENNLQLVERKLYYCDYLGWPGTCISALDEFKRQKGMTPQLLDQYATYYLIHEKYEHLLEIIDRWGSEFELKEDHNRHQILALCKLSQKRRGDYFAKRVYIG